ncbi:MAG: 30S ribosome-binding factor RbfA [Anaerolineales bacterium]
MTISEDRAKRIAQRIQEDLAVLLQRSAADPRLALVTVTDTEVDRELAYATVYVSAAGADADRKEILTALRGAAGFLRSQLAASIELRAFPRLRFRWDETPERAARIDELLAEIQSEHEDDEGEA